MHTDALLGWASTATARDCNLRSPLSSSSPPSLARPLSPFLLRSHHSTLHCRLQHAPLCVSSCFLDHTSRQPYNSFTTVPLDQTSPAAHKASLSKCTPRCLKACSRFATACRSTEGRVHVRQQWAQLQAEGWTMNLRATAVQFHSEAHHDQIERIKCCSIKEWD